MVRDKKLALKKNFGLISDVVGLWERLRPKSATREEREALVSAVLAKTRGKIVELANHHSASRVIQFCARDGAAADRKALLAEAREQMVPLAKSKYGHHLVQKIIAVAPKEEVPGARARLCLRPLAHALPPAAPIIIILHLPFSPPRRLLHREMRRETAAM